MLKKVIKAIIGVSIGLFVFGIVSISLTSNSSNTAQATTHKTAKAKSVKKYKVGKKYYTMKQMRKKYKLPFKQTKSSGAFNTYEGKNNWAFSGTYNALKNIDHSKSWTSHHTKYYTFTSVYLVGSKKKAHWNLEYHAIDMKSGHMYKYLSIGSAGGK